MWEKQGHKDRAIRLILVILACGWMAVSEGEIVWNYT